MMNSMGGEDGMPDLDGVEEVRFSSLLSDLNQCVLPQQSCVNHEMQYLLDFRHKCVQLVVTAVRKQAVERVLKCILSFSI